MTFEASGTGTDPASAQELATQMVTFLTTTIAPASNRWTLELDQNNGLLSTDPNYVRELIFSAPGSVGDPTPGTAVSFFIGMRFDNNAGTFTYVEMKGYTAYNPGLLGGLGVDWDNQPGASPSVYTPLAFNLTARRYFYGNGRRFIFVQDINGVAEAGYMGYINPYATQDEWPYPLCVMGTTDVKALTSVLTTTQDRRFHMFCTATRRGGSGSQETESGYLRGFDSVWYQMGSSVVSGNGNSTSWSPATGPVSGIYAVWPWGGSNFDLASTLDNVQVKQVPLNPDGTYTFAATNPDSADIGLVSSDTALPQLIRSPDSGGDRSLVLPMIIHKYDDVNGHEIAGEFDSIYYCAGEGRAQLDTIDATVGGNIEQFDIYKHPNQTERRFTYCIRNG